MRAFHLVGFRTVEGVAPRLLSSSEGPLVLPWWIPASDREILLAFYQQVLTDGVMPRLEVDWQQTLLEPDREFLRNVRARHGSTEYLVVVKVREEGVDLREVAAQPELMAFQHLAITAEFPVANVMLGRLRELCGLVTTTVEDRYRELATELSLPVEDGSMLEPIVRLLLNPIVILEAYNALVDVQVERIEPERYQEEVVRRVIRLASLCLGMNQLTMLGRLAAGRLPTAGEWEPEWSEGARRLLRDAMLLRAGRPAGWASLITKANEEVLIDFHRDQFIRMTIGASRDEPFDSLLITSRSKPEPTRDTTTAPWPPPARSRK